MRTALSILSSGNGSVPRLSSKLLGNSSNTRTRVRMSTSDFSDLLLLFEGWEIRYLVVGGYAVMVYTNATKVFAALDQFGAPMNGYTAADFATADMVYQIGVPPIRIDILTSITGVEFAEAWLERERRPFQTCGAWFISREHLLTRGSAMESARLG